VLPLSVHFRAARIPVPELFDKFIGMTIETALPLRQAPDTAKDNSIFEVADQRTSLEQQVVILLLFL